MLLIYRLSENTYSLWGYIWTHLDDFVNPLYEREEQEQLLTPKIDVPFLRYVGNSYCVLYFCLKFLARSLLPS